MAGRAGRRGKDKVGTVVVVQWGEQLPTELSLSKLLAGTATALASKFRLTYSMILSLLRSGGLSVEEMIKRSFSEFHTQKALQNNNIGMKLKKWKSGINILKQLLRNTKCQHLCSTNSCLMEEYAQYYHTCRTLNTTLLRNISNLNNSTNTASISASTTAPSSDYVRDTLLSPGQVVVVHYSDTQSKLSAVAAPSVAVVLHTEVNTNDAKAASSAVVTTSQARAAASTGSSVVTSSQASALKKYVYWLLLLAPAGVHTPLSIAAPATVKHETAALTAEKAAANSTLAGPGGMFVLKKKDDFEDMKFSSSGGSKGKKASSSTTGGGTGGAGTNTVVSKPAVGPLNWTEKSSACDVMGASRVYAILKLSVSEIVFITNEKI